MKKNIEEILEKVRQKLSDGIVCTGTHCQTLNILNLPLKGKWYDMITSGIKKEEYRDIKPYWIKRLCIGGVLPTGEEIQTKYTHVLFRYGYTKKTILFPLVSLTVGKGKPEWGGTEEEVFILKLGNQSDHIDMTVKEKRLTEGTKE